MQFDYCSDLHLDFDGASSRVLNHFPKKRSPTLILAGDIMELGALKDGAASKQLQIRRFFEWVSLHYQTVLYVLGNHEYYDAELNSGIQEIRDTFKSMGLNNITVLENDTIEFEDVLLFGSTLWTSCSQRNPIIMSNVQRSLADYRKISTINTDGEKTRITADHTITLHEESMAALHRFLQTPTRKKRIVVTHHAPHIESIELYYRKSLSRDGFYEELFELIVDSDIHTWIHGHTHFISDYLIGNTRVVSNQRGYYACENTEMFKVKNLLN